MLVKTWCVANDAQLVEHVTRKVRPNTVKLGEAPLVGRPITTYAATEAARTYRELAREVVDLGTN